MISAAAVGEVEQRPQRRDQRHLRDVERRADDGQRGDRQVRAVGGGEQREDRRRGSSRPRAPAGRRRARLTSRIAVGTTSSTQCSMPRPRFAERDLAVLHEVRRAAGRRRGARPASSRGAGRSRAPGAASGVTSSTGSPCSRTPAAGPVVVDLAQRARRRSACAASGGGRPGRRTAPCGRRCRRRRRPGPAWGSDPWAKNTRRRVQGSPVGHVRNTTTTSGGVFPSPPRSTRFAGGRQAGEGSTSEGDPTVSLLSGAGRSRPRVPAVLLALTLSAVLGTLAGPAPRPAPTAPASAPRGSSPSATPTSPARPAAGPAAPTTRRRTPTRSARTAYFDNAGGTAEHDQPLPPQQGPPRSTSAAASTASTWPAPARRPRRSPTATATSSPASTSTTTAPASRARRKMLQHVRGHPQREDGRGLDRRQRLQLRRRSSSSASPTSSTSPTWWKDYCNDDSSVTANFTSANVARGPDAGSRRRYAERPAPRCATPGTPTPRGRCWCRTTRRRSRTARGFRYSESGYTRQSTGGCGFWNADADWANATALPTINSTVTGAISQAGHHQRQDPRPGLGVQRPPAVREHRRPLRGEGPDLAGPSRRGRPDRVDQPDPHGVDVLLGSPLLHPGVAAPELLGPAGHPLLRAAGLERRDAARRHLHASPAPGWSTASRG